MHLLLSAYISIAAADAITQERALRLYGAHEVMLTQHARLNDAIIAAETASTTIAAERLHRQHPRLAKTILIAGIAWRAVAVGANLRAMRREK